MLFNSLKATLFGLLLVSVLAACSSNQIQPDIEGDASRAERLAKAGEYELAAQVQLNLARNTTGSKQQEHAIMAADLALKASKLTLARDALALAGATPRTDPDVAVRYRNLMARLLMAENNPQAAFEQMPTTLRGVSPDLQITTLLLRADVLDAINKPYTAIRQRVAVDKLIQSPPARLANQQNIWASVQKQGSDTLFTWSSQIKRDETRGWLDLGYLVKTTPLSVGALADSLSSWRNNYPAHPADISIVPELMKEWANFSILPKRIAVILPFTGRYAQVGEAVAGGIQAALYNTATEQRPELIFIDQGESPTPIDLQYQNAIDEQADFVIGPLLDNDAALILANRSDLPIPVLSLTYIDDQEIRPENFYQFGLLPEDEARQAAKRAAELGYLRAMILAPDSDWGARMTNSFTETFEELGGMISVKERYEVKGSDHRDTLKRALGIFQSEARERQLRNTIKRTLQFEPRRRADIDVIFLAASPRQARLLQPQLKFHRAGDLPILATSTINDGKEIPRLNRDLNGIEFTEIPWLTKPGKYQLSYNESLPYLPNNAQQRLPRLVALGIDSLQILPYLSHLTRNDYERFEGTTGHISVDEQLKLHRNLDWATFSHGLMEPINELDDLVSTDGS